MSTFQKLGSHFIPVLQATLEQYVDPASGARHVHLASEQEELVFLVGFPTVPQVSDGRAHILEHLALCGSERYPVADPFFAMMRRSTATFMNAMTYPDRTVYPFASTDRADFFNLLDVYLDATFFPKLDYLSFRQEGWRHTVKDGQLGYQGVVLNEMKGAFGNPMRALNRGIDEALFAGTTYAVESGGDPLVIPELSHQMLLDFHASHYHPSQAMFMTAGRIAAADVQDHIQQRVLSRSSGRSAPRMPELAPVWDAPRQIEVRVPSQEARADEFGVQLAWRLGESSDPLAVTRLQLLGRGLLGDASAPVLKAMESAGFGRPSAMNGADTGSRQLDFHLGMEGLTEDQIEPALAVIRQALDRAAAEGVPAEVFQAALRDMRYRQREVRGGSMPDALGRLLGAVPALMYGGPVLAAFDNEPVLNQLEQQIADPDFFPAMVRELIANPTHVVVRVVPDAQYATRRGELEAQSLAAQQATLDEAQLQRIRDEDEAIAAHRKAGSRTDVLPRIAPSDVSTEPRHVPVVDAPAPDLSAVSIPSNGISYATLLVDLSSLPREDWPWLSLYAELMPELGVGDLGYEQAGAWRQQLVPSFGMYMDALQEAGRPGLTPRLGYFCGGLQEKQADMAEVMRAWALSPRFDETERIAFLVKSGVEQTLSSLAEAGGQLASLAATAPLSAKRRFDHEVHGLASLPFVSALKAQLQQADGAKAIAQRLEQLHQRILACPRRMIWAGSERRLDEALALLEATAPVAAAASSGDQAEAAAPLPPANTALVLSTQVNHCYLAWPAPDSTQPDAAPLAVAAELLTHRILHRRLREEGGAYGGSAGYAGEDGLFLMNSFRDPRLAGTYADFAAALDELQAADYDAEAMDEAIISVIKRLDKPQSPYAQAMEADRLQRRGMTLAVRQQFRARVLGCTLAQVKQAVANWLKPEHASRAAAGRADQDLAGLQPVDVLALAS